MRQILKGPISLFALITLLLQSAEAQWQRNGIPICNDFRTQEKSDIVTDGAGGAFIVWEDMRPNAPPMNRDIYFQRVDSVGVIQFQTNGIAIADGAAGQYSFKLLPDGSGGFFIVWAESGNGGLKLQAQHILSNGSEAWAHNGVTVKQPVNSESQYGIAQHNGELLVAYSVSGVVPTSSVCVQKISTGGNLLWGNGKIIYTGAGYPYVNVAAPDYTGGFYIVWHFDKNVGTGLDLAMQRVNSDGDTLWVGNGSGKVICNAAGTQEKALICSSDDGKAVVGWWDHRSGGGGVQVDVYGLALDTAGAILWGGTNGKGIATASNQQQLRTLTNSAGGDVLFIWDDNRDSRNGFDVYCARLDGTNGNFAWNTPVVSLSGSQASASAIKDGAGGAYVTWMDARNPGKGIYGQKMNSSGNLIWITSGVALTTTLYGPSATSHVVADNSGGLIACWDNGYDVFANRIYSGGYPLPVELRQFSAMHTAEGVLLTWTTESEKNNFGFYVERKEDGSEWKAIAFVDGLGNIDTQKMYRYLDVAIEKNSITFYEYRLKQLDFDGSVNYSRSISINTSEKIVEQDCWLEQNFPNPFFQSTSIPFVVNDKIHLTIDVFNILGRKISTITNGEFETGKHSVHFVTAGIPSGVYLYSLTGAGKRQWKTMNIINNENR